MSRCELHPHSILYEGLRLPLYRDEGVQSASVVNAALTHLHKTHPGYHLYLVLPQPGRRARMLPYAVALQLPMHSMDLTWLRRLGMRVLFGSAVELLDQFIETYPEDDYFTPTNPKETTP